MYNVGAMVSYMDYTPRTLEEMEQQLVGKILSRFGIEAGGFHRWNG